MSRAIDEAVLEGLTDAERRALLDAAGRFARAELVLNNIAIVGLAVFGTAMMGAFGVLPFLRSRWISEYLFEAAPVVMAIVIGLAWLVFLIVLSFAASKSIRQRAVMRAVGSHARRAVCVGCGYSLLGLAERGGAAGEGLSAATPDRWTKLACPECGMVCPLVRVVMAGRRRGSGPEGVGDGP